MKNNTKIRLHLSKNLFESIAKEVLSEAKKANDGYSVAVKQPKQPKQSKAQAASPEVQKTNKEKTMDEMSSKEKMAKGLYKEEDMDEMQINVAEDGDVLQPGDNITWLDGHQKENKGVVQSQEGGDYYKVKVTAAPMGGGAKVGDVITKQSGDVKKDVSTVKEYVGVEQTTGLITALATLLGIGVPLATSLYKDLKGKTPQEKKQVLQSLAGQMDKISGGDSTKGAAPKEESFSLNELRKKNK